MPFGMYESLINISLGTHTTQRCYVEQSRRQSIEALKF